MRFGREKSGGAINRSAALFFGQKKPPRGNAAAGDRNAAGRERSRNAAGREGPQRRGGGPQRRGQGGATPRAGRGRNAAGWGDARLAQRFDIK